MVLTYSGRTWKKEYIIKEYKAMLIAPQSKFKKWHDTKKNNANKFVDIDMKFKGFPFRKTPVGERDYFAFLRKVYLLYKVYLKIKSANSFDNMISKMENISDYEIIGYRKGPKYFDFSKKLDEYYPHYFEVYIISKWLKFKPNKKFEPIFEEVCKLLDDKKWW